jgi:uncharacterized protein (UPF0335 family)
MCAGCHAALAELSKLSAGKANVQQTAAATVPSGMALPADRPDPEPWSAPASLLSCSALSTTQSRNAGIAPALTSWLFFRAHFHGLLHQRGTMSDISIPGGRIRSFIERIENLDSELQELNEQKKEVFSEAKGEGFDVKILKEIIKLRKQDQDERDEHETLLEVYLRAIETAEKEPQAKAA